MNPVEFHCLKKVPSVVSSCGETKGFGETCDAVSLRVTKKWLLLASLSSVQVCAVLTGLQILHSSVGLFVSINIMPNSHTSSVGSARHLGHRLWRHSDVTMIVLHSSVAEMLSRGCPAVWLASLLPPPRGD